jgi:hypothetical protein
LFVPHAIPGKTMTVIFQEKRDAWKSFIGSEIQGIEKNKIFLLRQENKKRKKICFYFR